MEFLKYIRYSNIQIALNLNPFTWGFIFKYNGPSDLDPGMYCLHIKFLMIRLSFVIDNGSW